MPAASARRVTGRRLTLFRRHRRLRSPRRSLDRQARHLRSTRRARAWMYLVVRLQRSVAVVLEATAASKRLSRRPGGVGPLVVNPRQPNSPRDGRGQDRHARRGGDRLRRARRQARPLREPETRVDLPNRRSVREIIETIGMERTGAAKPSTSLSPRRPRATSWIREGARRARR